ncbi:MAG: permease-like cell division protein FtsX [bacterium]|nr:permease-like cell division protein FtsX [bacterium]
MPIKYFAAETLTNFKRTETWLIVGAITLVCFGFGLCLNLAGNVRSSLEDIGKQTTILVYLEKNLSKKNIGQLKEAILKMEGIKKVEHVSSIEALARLKEDLAFSSSMESSLFPDFLEVYLTEDGFSERVRQFSQTAPKINELAGVKEVDYGAEVIESLARISQISRFVMWAIALVSALIIFSIISGAIRSAVAARIKTIETLKSLGATNRFIGWPFILEGIFQAVIGSTLAIIFLWIVHQLGLRSLVLFPSLSSGLSFFSLTSVIFLILASGFLGGIGSFFSIWDILKGKGGHYLAFCCAGIILFSGVAYAENIKTYEKELTDGQKNLERISREIEKERDKLIGTKKKKREVENELLELNTELRKNSSSSSKLGQEAKQINVRLKKFNYDIATTNQKLLKSKEMLSSSLANMYKYSRISWIDALFNTRDLPTLLKYSYFTRFSTQYVSRQIKELENKKEMVDTKRKNLKYNYQQILSQKGKVGDDYQKKKQERLAKVKLLNKIAGEENIRQNRIAQLNKASNQIEELLRQLGEKKKQALTEPVKPTGLLKKLAWPVKGRKILIGFGKQNHPEFKTSFINKGIDIAADLGETVTPSAEGKVVFVGPFKGYEGMVMLDHGGNRYTVYGHLGDVQVGVEDRVTLTTPLGKVGDGGQIDGQPCLHLELRVKGQAVDPGKYLR